ncbi:hypothetical protein V501_00671 [Pseudogymnoascus sp. VKM F-4519 (FW-2642)]|nr:hypothetical protein V501_00671 [Pseudogymnoascus sp. VKM F-4519 (FW-2642)]
MDNESTPSALGTMHHGSPQLPLPLKVGDLRSWSPSQYSYQGDGARSSRIIIESSSYHTTPCGSPPKESPTTPCGSPPKESPPNLDVKRIADEDYTPQEIFREREQRNCAISDNRETYRRINSRKNKFEEARSCDLTAREQNEEMSERSKGDMLNFNSCEGDGQKASKEVSK